MTYGALHSTPVMTTLVMAGILIFGVVAYRQLRSVTSGGGLPYHLGECQPGRASPRPCVLSGDAARKAVLHHPRGRT